MKTLEKHYTLPQVAGFLGNSPKTLRRWIAEGTLQGKLVRGQWRVAHSEVERLLR
jgi:excisionase family DNA binding protein